MTPDWATKPVTVPYANFGNPQSLNLYAYVENNPMTLGDPDGHQNGTSNQSKGDAAQTTNCHAVNVEPCNQPASTTEQAKAVNQSAQDKPEYQNPQNESEAKLANVTYNEVGGLHPDPKAKADAPGSIEQLHEAQLAVAEIANRVLNSDHPEHVQVGVDLTSKTVSDINAGSKSAIVAHNEALAAARAALGGSNTTKGAMHYNTSPNKMKLLYGKKATNLGPFQNAQGGKRYLVWAP